MDILAYHRTENCWLIVELKRDKGYKETVGQILRYMGWFKENRADKDERVKGLIISSMSDNKDLYYSLLYVPDVDHQIYYVGENDEAHFMDYEKAYEISKVTDDDIQKFISLKLKGEV